MKVKYEMNGKMDFEDIVNELKTLNMIAMDLGIDFEITIKRV